MGDINASFIACFFNTDIILRIELFLPLHFNIKVDKFETACNHRKKC